ADDTALWLTIRDDDAIWKCFRCDWRGRRSLQSGASWCERSPRPAPPKPAAIHDRTTLLVLLKRLRPIEGGTPVETYIHSRGLELPPPGHHLRFLPANPPKHPWPAMVAVVTAFDDARKVMTLHFTRLAVDGTAKAPIPQPRSFLAGHSKKGGVIRFTDNADV